MLCVLSANAVAGNVPYQLGNARSCLVGYGLPVVRDGANTLIWKVGPGGERIYIDFGPTQPVSGAHADARIAVMRVGRRATANVGNVVWYTSAGQALTWHQRTTVGSCLR